MNKLVGAVPSKVTITLCEMGGGEGVSGQGSGGGSEPPSLSRLPPGAAESEQTVELVLGNQPDRLPGCQHLRNAKPALRQGWVLRAGCSGLGAPWVTLPVRPAAACREQHPGSRSARHGAPLPAGTLGWQVHGGAGWGTPDTGCCPGQPGLQGCWWGGRLPAGEHRYTKLAVTRGGCPVLGPAPRLGGDWDGSLLSWDGDRNQPGRGHREGRWG